MSSVRFNKEHEWVRLEATEAVVGITDYAQSQLGDIVHVDLPKLGQRIEQGQQVAAIESVKVASDLYAPVSGEIIGVNDALTDTPATINADPMGEGWFFKVRVEDTGAFEALIDEAAYQAFVGVADLPNP